MNAPRIATLPDDDNQLLNVCPAHSGILMWMRITSGIGIVISTLLIYQIFFQTKEIQLQLIKETAALSAKLDIVTSEIVSEKMNVLELQKRVEKLENYHRK